MRYKQAVIEYSMKHGVTKAAIRYKTSRQNIYRWKKEIRRRHSLAGRSLPPSSQPSKAAHRGWDHAGKEYAPKESTRWSGSILGQTSPTWIQRPCPQNYARQKITTVLVSWSAPWQRPICWSWMSWAISVSTDTSLNCCLRLFQTVAKRAVPLLQRTFLSPNGQTSLRIQPWLLPSLTDWPSVLIFWTWTEIPTGWDLPCKTDYDWVAQIFVSVAAHFFVSASGSKIHGRMAHFSIDIYTQTTE